MKMNRCLRSSVFGKSDSDFISLSLLQYLTRLNQMDASQRLKALFTLDFGQCLPSIARTSNGGCTLRTSAISVPLPGPNSTKSHSVGRSHAIHSVRIQIPTISPNIWDISGEVIKSPMRPKGSGELV